MKLHPLRSGWSLCVHLQSLSSVLMQVRLYPSAGLLPLVSLSSIHLRNLSWKWSLQEVTPDLGGQETVWDSALQLMQSFQLPLIGSSTSMRYMFVIPPIPQISESMRCKWCKQILPRIFSRLQMSYSLLYHMVSYNMVAVNTDLLYNLYYSFMQLSPLPLLVKK